MIRRNIIIVDDVPILGEKVDKIIKQYYSSKQVYEYNIILFLDDNHFKEAKQYIQNRYEDIDVIFSDQNLRGGKGTDLFKSAEAILTTEYSSIKKQSHICRVMHSNVDTRLKEHIKEYSFAYDFFINSEKENDITAFLDEYENKILTTKEYGNTGFKDYLYTIPKSKKGLEYIITIDRYPVKLSDILFILMDKNKDNSEYYHFFYNKDGKTIKSIDSKKPDRVFNDIVKSLSFLEGTLLDEGREKFKINPLWIAYIKTGKKTITLLPYRSLRFELKFEKLDHEPNFPFLNTLDKFFL